MGDIQVFLLVSAVLFCSGLIVVLTRRHAVMMLIGVELMLNAANINLIAFSRYDPVLLQGQFLTLFVMVIAAAEAAVGLAIILKVFEHLKSPDPNVADRMKN
ncbi:NADH-quinone oxidoreductase subunit NuoK [Cytophagaceae bacterium ABcell3]|nr:NADH-quinone oxidoreductase subunit NuoK [Cytophagaceae bacterium ABcell3]